MVLEGGFGLWLGDNIAILSMVKRAHLLFLTQMMVIKCDGSMFMYGDQNWKRESSPYFASNGVATMLTAIATTLEL